MMLEKSYPLLEKLFHGKIWIFFTLTIACLAYICVKKRRFQQSLFERIGIPFVKPHLIYGSLHVLRGKNNKGNELKIMSSWIKEYGSCFGYYLGTVPYLVVSDLDMVKQILVKDFSNFVNRPRLPIEAQPAVVTLVGLRDKEWKDVRSLLTPTFTGAKIKLMISVMNKKVDEMIRIIEKTSGNETHVGFYTIYQGLTLDIISECALALKTNCQRDQSDDPFFKSVRQFLKNAINPVVLWSMYFPILAKILAAVYNRLGLPSRATQIIISNLKKVIAYRRKNAHLRNNDLLQLMLDSADGADTEQNGVNGKSNPSSSTSLPARKTLTDEKIIANAWVFLLAGFETSSAALTHATYLLAKHPQIQEKLYEELFTYFKDETDHISYETVTGLPYLDQVFNESLRVYPPVVNFLSRETKDDILIKDLFIPKGMNLTIPVWDIHHNPDYWSEPFKFDPERFSTSSKASEARHTMSFIPFGEGPRMCIGMRFAQMESKLAIARIISKFRLEICDKTPDPLTFEIPTVTLNPIQDVFLKVIKR